MKSLVVYYSRSGNTKLVAETIAKQMGCDIEEIIDNKNRDGIIGYIGGVLNHKGPTTIKEMNSKPGDYDLVIIGTPIWWYTCTPAVTAYLKQYGKDIKRAAFFYTCNVDNKISALKDMEGHLGRSPVSTFGIEKPKKNTKTMDKKLKGFIREIKAG